MDASMRDFFDLMRPIGKGSTLRARALMREHRLPVTLRDESGRSALAWAIAADDLPFAVELIVGGADVNEPDAWGASPLHRARSAGAVHILMKARANINAVASNGRTPVATAAEHATPDLFRTLLEYKPDLNVPDVQGRVVAHHVLARLDDTKDQMMFGAYKAGANFDQPDHHGLTARELFARQEQLRSLETVMAELETIFGGAARAPQAPADAAAPAPGVAGEPVAVEAASQAAETSFYGFVRADATEKDFLASLGLSVGEYDHATGHFPVSVPAAASVDVTHYLTAVRYDYQLTPVNPAIVENDPATLGSKDRAGVRAWLEYELSLCPEAGARQSLEERLSALAAAAPTGADASVDAGRGSDQESAVDTAPQP